MIRKFIIQSFRSKRLTINLAAVGLVRNDIYRAKTAMTRKVGIIIHPGFQLLDAAGPAAAFELAEGFCVGSYMLEILAPGGGEIESSSGMRLAARPLSMESRSTPPSSPVA